MLATASCNQLHGCPNLGNVGNSGLGLRWFERLGGPRVQPYVCKANVPYSHESCLLGIVMGNPGVFQGYLDPYPDKPVPTNKGKGSSGREWQGYTLGFRGFFEEFGGVTTV
jgi:hypothetical protein